LVAVGAHAAGCFLVALVRGPASSIGFTEAVNAVYAVKAIKAVLSVRVTASTTAWQAARAAWARALDRRATSTAVRICSISQAVTVVVYAVSTVLLGGARITLWETGPGSSYEVPQHGRISQVNKPIIIHVSTAVIAIQNSVSLDNQAYDAHVLEV
jgi:hypothetical protein